MVIILGTVYRFRLSQLIPFVYTGSSFQLRSAQDNVRKYVNIPNCFTISKITVPVYCFQYAGVSLTSIHKCNHKLQLFLLYLSHFVLIVRALALS